MLGERARAASIPLPSRQVVAPADSSGCPLTPAHLLPRCPCTRREERQQCCQKEGPQRSLQLCRGWAGWRERYSMCRVVTSQSPAGASQQETGAMLAGDHGDSVPALSSGHRGLETRLFYHQNIFGKPLLAPTRSCQHLLRNLGGMPQLAKALCISKIWSQLNLC